TLARAAEGGPLVDTEGNLIGMAVFGPRRRVLAIPHATIAPATDAILAHGPVGRGYIRVSVQSVRVDGADESRAALAVGLDPEGPAKKAGLLLGAIILTWDGDAVSGPRSVVHRLGPGTIGNTVKLGLSRAGTPAELTLTVGERPST